MMFCRNCGKELDSGVRFCRYCGTRVEDMPEQNVRIDDYDEATQVFGDGPSMGETPSMQPYYHDRAMQSDGPQQYNGQYGIPQQYGGQHQYNDQYGGQQQYNTAKDQGYGPDTNVQYNEPAQPWQDPDDHDSRGLGKKPFIIAVIVILLIAIIAAAAFLILKRNDNSSSEPVETYSSSSRGNYMEDNHGPAPYNDGTAETSGSGSAYTDFSSGSQGDGSDDAGSMVGSGFSGTDEGGMGSASDEGSYVSFELPEDEAGDADSASGSEETDQESQAQSDTDSLSSTGFIFPDSDSRYISESELAGLTEDELRIARNEIYARKGRKFQDSELQEYFSQFDWYNPTIDASKFTESMLNAYEVANVNTIAGYEKKKGYR